MLSVFVALCPEEGYSQAALKCWPMTGPRPWRWARCTTKDGHFKWPHKIEIYDTYKAFAHFWKLQGRLGKLQQHQRDAFVCVQRGRQMRERSKKGT